MLRVAAVCFILAPMLAGAQQIIITVPVPAPVVPSRFGAGPAHEAHESMRRGLFRRWGDRMRARREMHREMAARYGWPTMGVPVPVPVPFSNGRTADPAQETTPDGVPEVEIEIPENPPAAEPVRPAPAASEELPPPAPVPAPVPAAQQPPSPNPSANTDAPVLPAPPLPPQESTGRVGPRRF